MKRDNYVTMVEEPLPLVPEKVVGPNSTLVPWRKETLGLPPKPVKPELLATAVRRKKKT